jgi:hypothetical protein
MDRPANLLRRASDTTDVAVSELNASGARKTGIGSKAGIYNTAVPAGLLNQIF